TDDPVTILFQVLQRLRQIGRGAYWHRIDRSGAHFRHGRRERYAAMFPDDDPIRADRIRTAHDRSQIMRILQFIKHDDEPILSLWHPLKDLIYAVSAIRIDTGRNALMMGRLHLRVELRAAYPFH